MKITYEKLAARLYESRSIGGWWEGRLSSSALSTALAVFALSLIDSRQYRELIERGFRWLAQNVNEDGGWGDTPDSPGNVATTALCWSAFSAADPGVYGAIVNRAEGWLRERSNGGDVSGLVAALRDCYGEDRTFSAPILAMCALAGRLGDGDSCWRHVPQLPFELALMPQKVLKGLRLSVVSYALPALIAIGLLRFERGGGSSSPAGMFRRICRAGALNVLERLQPANGGFLEAVPLTSFVVMSLAGAGYAQSGIVSRGASFLVKSVREDGSWPIDTNLATWVTTLAVNAISGPGHKQVEGADDIRRWLLSQQFSERHRYTGAEPGGWAWTDLPGGVPDADDTAGALLALINLGGLDKDGVAAGLRGVRWLIDLQNRDGGVPTFCRGWGRLPFDRSCPDITAHAFRALHKWRPHAGRGMSKRIDVFMDKAFLYLCNVQRDAGFWVPLWFGNQHAHSAENPVYGTAQVVISLTEAQGQERPGGRRIIEKGSRWLASAQNADGGWGGVSGAPSSVEETALAVNALAGQGFDDVLAKGLEWLDHKTGQAEGIESAPIGLYFAKLWYSEQLYPLIFTTAALAKCSSSSETSV